MENYKRIIIDNVLYSVPKSVVKKVLLLKAEAYLTKSWEKHNTYCNEIKTKYKGKIISGIYKTKKHGKNNRKS